MKIFTKVSICITVIIAAVAIPVSAIAGTNAKKIDFCARLSKTAGKVMRMRQEGRPMSDLMKIADKNGPLYVHIVKIAYETPRCYADENKQTEIEDFENEIFLECIKSLEKEFEK